MIGAEQTGRKARMIELSEEYVAIILQRMQDAFPNLLIELVSDGA